MQETVWLVFVDHENGCAARIRSVHKTRVGAELAGTTIAMEMGMLDEDRFLPNTDFPKGIIAEQGQTSIMIEERQLWA